MAAMRIRSFLSFSAGAAVGAGAMYLMDPEQGPARRREARRDALRGARRGATACLANAARYAGEVARSAAQGYRQSQFEAELDGLGPSAER
jgi:hypothetical protein